MGLDRLGVDIGGTFTDIVLARGDGSMVTRKVPSTPDDYGRAIVESVGELLESLGLDPTAIREVIHGTTVATNTILEHKGARTGLLTTRGFRDILEIGRLRYPRLYDLTWIKPPPLVERHARLEVVERLDSRGRVVEPLDERSARAAIERLLGDGIESLAVSLLHSYANPSHERRLGELIAELAPELPLSLSSEILPEVGEYERTSTTVINAYIQPVVGRYLADLTENLGRLGLGAPLLVMQSNGGIMSVGAASERPIHVVESGPAAGVIGAQTLARRLGRDVITLDMGGTTAKASIVEDGRCTYTSEYEVGGGLNVGNRLSRGAAYPLRVPAIDIAEVGAGGGSLVWLDAAGSVHVGPQSAGAVPGPVCYRAGGTEPTLTDANVLLGYLNPEALLGGALPIDRRHTQEVFEARIARPLGLGVHEAAYGVHQIGVASMVRVVKAVSSERGRDPRTSALVAFGGNGPVHAAAVAAELGIRQVVVPPRPGLFSAFGLLLADVTHRFSRTILRPTHALRVEDLEGPIRELEALAGETLAREGYGAGQVRLERAADLRYVGQSFELRVPVDDGPITEALVRGLDARFAAEHERTYGHAAESDPVELVHVRVAATAVRDEARSWPTGGSSSGQSPPSTRRPAYFGREHGPVDTPVLTRSAVGSRPIPGPAIVEEYDATTVVPPGYVIWRDEADNLVLELGAES